MLGSGAPFWGAWLARHVAVKPQIRPCVWSLQMDRPISFLPVAPSDFLYLTPPGKAYTPPYLWPTP
ncbi:uncharacterized protein DS421_16g545950 [Arachis hypogaea]|nr:uncharacterized protein DS421_16g545950 [Arachis hypogaea]